MLSHPTMFFAALFSGALGFGGISGSFIGIAQILFVVFSAVLIALLLAERPRHKPDARLQAWRQTRWTRERLL
jgi:uncharacterized membrane protein YtjA (UPF0391 family)